jgi:hypothetical protein
MTHLIFMLAQEEVDVASAFEAWSPSNPEARNRLIMVAVFGVFILALLVWAAFIRKAKKKRKRITRPHGWEIEAEKNSEHRRRHKQHHKRQRGERPRNPTLAESGGLPPVRPQSTEPPPPPA